VWLQISSGDIEVFKILGLHCGFSSLKPSMLVPGVTSGDRRCVLSPFSLLYLALWRLIMVTFQRFSGLLLLRNLDLSRVVSLFYGVRCVIIGVSGFLFGCSAHPWFSGVFLKSLVKSVIISGIGGVISTIF
jgi:hypothetical protein